MKSRFEFLLHGLCNIAATLITILLCISFMDQQTVAMINGSQLYYDETGNINRDMSMEFAEKRENTEKYEININKAVKAELLDIPWIGQKTAEKIIMYREEKLFTKIDELMNIDGIGETKLDSIKNYVCIK